PTATVTPSVTPTATAAPAVTPPSGWRAVEALPPGPLVLTELRMIDAQHGWALGGAPGRAEARVLVTADGARTWREVTPPLVPPTNRGPVSALFWDADTAWVAYGYESRSEVATMGVWATHQQGQRWVWAPIPAAEDVAAYPWFRPGPLSAVDERRAWILVHLDAGMGQDYALLAGTTDGGFAWQVLADPFSERAADLMVLMTSGLAFAPDGQYGWATKQTGPIPAAVVAVTRDGGLSWESRPFLPPEHTEAFCTTADPHLWAPGRGALLAVCVDPEAGAEQAFVVLWDHDEVVAWVPLPGEAPTLQARLVFVNEREGYAALSAAEEDASPETRLYFTTDGGHTWALAGQVPGRARFSWLPGGEGWALVSEGQEVQVVHTADRGRTWSLLPTPRLVTSP
ncbi:MAG: hypothetical protein GXO37_01490, partial [Chloroflexi bacterium]|nr:hypothetical protein [Chloroflexota bacterium]